jgi:hypothetical protein
MLQFFIESIRLQSYATIVKEFDIQFKLEHYNRALVDNYFPRHRICRICTTKLFWRYIERDTSSF